MKAKETCKTTQNVKINKLRNISRALTTPERSPLLCLLTSKIKKKKLIKCTGHEVYHFSLQILLETYFVSINIQRVRLEMRRC
jgi:hypothetical protein